MKAQKLPSPHHLLREILAQDPRASLDEIRRAHPVFRSMSFDHLGLRVSRMLDQQAIENAA